jgi:hypothetical protein
LAASGDVDQDSEHSKRSAGPRRGLSSTWHPGLAKPPERQSANGLGVEFGESVKLAHYGEPAVCRPAQSWVAAFEPSAPLAPIMIELFSALP